LAGEAVATVADRAWQELIDRSVVRDPRVAGSLPPAWRNPAEGTPAPNEGPKNPDGSPGVTVGPTLVVGLVETGGIAPDRYESDWTIETMDVVVRATQWPLAKALWFQIRHALTDQYGWTMAGMRVIESRELNAFAMIDSSRAQGFTGRATVLFETYTEDHF
jgi:hypothetical protein